MRQETVNIRKLLVLIGLGIILLVAGLLVWQQQPVTPDVSVQSIDPYAGINFEDPSASYLMLCYVAEQGGDAYQRKLAIQWLDEQARRHLALNSNQETWLLSLIESGGHADWDIETRLWIFNEAFNVLRMSQDQHKLSELLRKITLEHPHKSMRLYALQHIELQRSAGDLTGSFADEIRGNLQELAHHDEEIAGAALAAVVNWNGEAAPPSQEIIDLALDIAADTERPTDIRVSAIHAVGDQTLALSRNLAADAQQPVLVRKAAIACIGKYGSEADTAVLKQLVHENFRIAQAAEPAIHAILHRETNAARNIIPF